MNIPWTHIIGFSIIILIGIEVAQHDRAQWEQLEARCDTEYGCGGWEIKYTTDHCKWFMPCSVAYSCVSVDKEVE